MKRFKDFIILRDLDTRYILNLHNEMCEREERHEDIIYLGVEAAEILERMTEGKPAIDTFNNFRGSDIQPQSNAYQIKDGYTVIGRVDILDLIDGDLLKAEIEKVRGRA